MASVMKYDIFEKVDEHSVMIKAKNTDLDVIQ
jgi:hypothetical protein